MALASRKFVEKKEKDARVAASVRVSGGRGVGAGLGQSLSIPLQKIMQSGTIVMAYQGSWPNPVVGGKEQFVQAFQYVSVTCEPENDNVQFNPTDASITRYWRTGYTGSGAALGITLESARGRYHAIPVKLMGMAFLWVESDENLKPGERVGSQTAVQGVGNAIYDHLGPSVLVRKLDYEDPLEENRELWLVRHTCLRGDCIMVYKPSTGKWRIAKTVLFDYDLFELSRTSDPCEVVVSVRS